MKKIFFASLVMLALGGLSYGQAPVAKTASKKEPAKTSSAVSSATPARTAKTGTAAKANAVTKPAAATSNQKVSATAIRKHKKPRHKTKKS